MRLSVHIIESPNPQDLMDGRTEGMLLKESLSLSETEHTYNLVTDLSTFEESIKKRFADAWLKNGFPPILHLSMHGNGTGIGLTDSTFIDWQTLNMYLEPLNNASNGGLLVCLSTCVGANGIQMAMNNATVKPFWALVGNTEPISWSDSAIAYSAFYHNIFKKLGIEQATEAMRVASANNTFLMFKGDSVKANWHNNMAKQAAISQQSLLAQLGITP